MKVSKFSNDLESAAIHTNDMATQPGQEKTFAERQVIDASRSIIGSYTKSRLGQAPSVHSRPRPTFNRPAERSTQSSANKQPVRQELNAAPQVPARTFIEPTSRGYNPYS